MTFQTFLRGHNWGKKENVLAVSILPPCQVLLQRHADDSQLQQPNSPTFSLPPSASLPPLDQRAGVNINPDRLVWKSLSHFIWKEVWQITEEGRIPQWQEVAALFTQTLWDPCSDMLLSHPVRRLFPKQTQPRLSLHEAGPHKLPEKDLECWGATRKHDVGKPNRPYKALDMVSLVNLTGVWCSLRGVKGKANFISAGPNTDQCCISCWKVSKWYQENLWRTAC